MDLLISWKEEKRSVYLYLALSKIEANPVHKKLFIDLSENAEKQALIWEEKLKEAHIPCPVYHPDGRARFLVWLLGFFGARALRTALAAMKIRGMVLYHSGDLTHPMPTSLEEGEHRHRSVNKGNTLRAAVFGINDGLLSNASLLLGMAGANAGNHFILLSGVAGLLAGACSMAAGEYVSVKSQREMLEYQLELEKSELELYPEEEAVELSLIYQARGLPKEDAEKLAQVLIQDPDKALDTLAREELGINPDDLMSPWHASLSSFVSFVVGASVPLLPFMVGRGDSRLVFSISLTLCALFLVGAMLSLFTQRSALWGGLRMLSIGAMAGALTYCIGHVFSIMLGSG